MKGNQGTLEENIEDTVRFTPSASDWKEEDFGHGRIETRHCFLYKDLSFVENAHRWKSLSALVKIESTRYIKSTGKIYYIFVSQHWILILIYLTIQNY